MIRRTPQIDPCAYFNAIALYSWHCLAAHIFSIETQASKLDNKQPNLSSLGTGFKYVKTAFVLLTLILSGGYLTSHLQDKPTQPHLEDWVQHTLALFTDATQYFRSQAQLTPVTTGLLDKKLQELLPSENIDFSYHPSSAEPQQPIQLAQDTPHGRLLPNFFTRQETASTSLSGKVHTDEDDNIIGAEVQIATPTSM